jgi:hypothetical protein
MGESMICTIAGPLISFVVSGLKKIPLVNKYPKFAAFFISALVGTFTAVHGSVAGISYSDIVSCVLIQFSAAVATHEAIVKPVAAKISPDNEPPAPPNSFAPSNR